MSEVDSMPPSSDSPSISVTAETAGPQPGVAYPLKVHYCGGASLNCTFYRNYGIKFAFCAGRLRN